MNRLCRINHNQADDKYHLQHKDKELEQIAERFLDRLRVRCLSAKTVEAYAYDLVYFFRWLDSFGKHISEFSYQELFEYMKHQVDAGAKPRSVNRRLVVCRLFINFLGEQGITVHSSHKTNGSSPVFRSSLGRWPTKRGSSSVRVKVPYDIVEPLVTSEINCLLKKSRRYRDISIILMMTLVGLRRAEVLAMTTHDIDFGKNTIRIRGKGRKERVMPLPALLAGSLTKYMRFERPRVSSTDKFFVILQGDHRGKPMTVEGLRSLFRRRRRATKVYHANPHRLRHSFAYSMIKSGVSVIVLQKMLGHAHYATTLRYCSLKVEDIAEQYLSAMKTIEKLHAQQT